MCKLFFNFQCIKSYLQKMTVFSFIEIYIHFISFSCLIALVVDVRKE